MSDLVGEFVVWFRDVKRKRASSVRQYEAVLIRYVATVGDPLAATPEMVEAFAGRLRGGRVPSAATVLKDRAAISAFHRWLQARGVRVDNPVELSGAPSLHNRAPRAVSDDVWCGLWDSNLPDDDRVFVGLLAFVGLRRMEVVQVAAAHFDMDRGRLWCPNRKGGKEMAVDFRDMVEVVADRLPHLLPDRELFFGPLDWLVRLRADDESLMPWMRDGLHETVVNRELCRVFEGARMVGTGLSPHAFRHMCATNLMRAGVPLALIADQLGHSSLETTRRYLRTSGELGRWRQERT